MSVFFGGEFFGGGFFQNLPTGEAVDVKTGGKGDNKRRSIVKPTGLPPYREPRKTVEERVHETREIHQEVREVLRLKPRKPIQEMSIAEIDSEIGERLRKQLQLTEEDEEIILMLLAAAVAG